MDKQSEKENTTNKADEEMPVSKATESQIPMFDPRSVFPRSSINALDVKFTDAGNILKLARVAEESDRFHDMCVLMKRAVSIRKAVKVEDRNLLSVAYKNVVGQLRIAWRKVSEELEATPEGQMREDLLTYLRLVEAELKGACNDIIELIEKEIIPRLDPLDHETNVFFLKMAADYYRYLAETKLDSGEKSVKFYSDAFSVAEKHLEDTHPTRLGLVLNYSVCIYEISRKPAEACRLAKTAFDRAISKLDTMDESTYKDSTLIMELLRDNITLWTSEEDKGFSFGIKESNVGEAKEGAEAEEEKEDKMTDEPAKAD